MQESYARLRETNRKKVAPGDPLLVVVVDGKTVAKVRRELGLERSA